MTDFNTATWSQYLRDLYPEGTDIREPALWGLAFVKIMEESKVPFTKDCPTVFNAYTSGLTPRAAAMGYQAVREIAQELEGD